MNARSVVFVIAMAGCHGKDDVVGPMPPAPVTPEPAPSAAPTGAPPVADRPATPIAHDTICVTKGLIDRGSVIGVREPTVRAISRGSSGDGIAMTFTYRGDSDKARRLSSGQMRRQLGLKLRAQNSCNVVYVMWRLDPKPELEVSLKANPGMRLHRECGAAGYTKIKPMGQAPNLEAGARHTLSAQITGDELVASIDGQVAWRGTLPPEARQIKGPAGFRSDNVAFDIEELSAPTGGDATSCHEEESD